MGETSKSSPSILTHQGHRGHWEYSSEIQENAKWTMKGLFTFTRICVEFDLSKGFPGHIQIKHKYFSWTQVLDYENTAFRCRTCFQTGHLQKMS